MAPSSEREQVILLHGLGRTARSMRRMERTLQRGGYATCNVDYPSLRHPVQFLAAHVLGDVVRQVQAYAPARLHFVTHSMGGLLVRKYLAHHRLPALGRVVMLSPPNRGSEVADALGRSALCRRLLGPAIQQMGTGADALPAHLPPIDFELGIITGTRALDPLGRLFVSGPNDGRVAVDRARVEGMTDFLVVPCTHTFIMRDRTVMQKTLHFLKHGAFQHTARETTPA